MADRIIIMVRHGQYASDGADEEFGPRLTKLGKQQALVTGRHLRQYPIQNIYFSPLNRARETAMIIASCVPLAKLRQAPLLKEVIPTAVPGMHVRNLRQQRSNADTAFERFFAPPGRADKYDCLVCHGNLIRYLLCRVLDTAAATWLKYDVSYHCALTECRIREDGRMLVSIYNNASHLTPRMRTTV